jgi:hypothetical protein
MRLGETAQGLGTDIACLVVTQHLSRRKRERGLVGRDSVGVEDETYLLARDRPVEPRRVDVSEQEAQLWKRPKVSCANTRRAHLRRGAIR